MRKTDARLDSPSAGGSFVVMMVTELAKHIGRYSMRVERMSQEEIQGDWGGTAMIECH